MQVVRGGRVCKWCGVGDVQVVRVGGCVSGEGGRVCKW